MNYEKRNRLEVIKELEEYKKECDCGWVNEDIKLLSGIPDEYILVETISNSFVLEYYEPKEYERIEKEILLKQNRIEK